MRKNNYGVEIDQRYINFIQFLETRYKVDIKRTVDYVEIRNKWINEGKVLPTPKVVRLRASKVGRKPIYQKIPHGIPIRWKDQ